MAIRAKENKIFLFVILPITVNVVNCKRHLTGHRIPLVPAALATLLTVFGNQVATNVP